MKLSAIEALANTVIGLGVSWAVTYFLLPMWGLRPSVPEAGAIRATYFVISFARSWVIHEVFRRLG